MWLSQLWRWTPRGIRGLGFDTRHMSSGKCSRLERCERQRSAPASKVIWRGSDRPGPTKQGPEGETCVAVPDPRLFVLRDWRRSSIRERASRPRAEGPCFSPPHDHPDCRLDNKCHGPPCGSPRLKTADQPFPGPMFEASLVGLRGTKGPSLSPFGNGGVRGRG